MMSVDQAIFASSNRGRMQGYQLVARSPGVDRAVAQELCQWAPTQAPSANPDHWTVNCFPVSEDLIAITRTTLGGPEYSCRGSIQVVTLILLLRGDQFMNYGCNAIAVAKTALSMGHLRLPLEMTCESLPEVTLPHRPLIDPLSGEGSCFQSAVEDALLDEVEQLILANRRVAVIGQSEPIEATERLIAKLAVETRNQFSFTTGLVPAQRRPFQLHFLPELDLTKRRTLDSQGIVCVGENGLPVLHT
ncbi:MAG: hypothetical protein MI861_26995 [Pirellulales bacterium]|nr:hypothetical protein [Pirellulales bacterium]